MHRLFICFRPPLLKRLGPEAHHRHLVVLHQLLCAIFATPKVFHYQDAFSLLWKAAKAHSFILACNVPFSEDKILTTFHVDHRMAA